MSSVSLRQVRARDRFRPPARRAECDRIGDKVMAAPVAALPLKRLSPERLLNTR